MAPDISQDPSIVIVEHITDSSSLDTEDVVTSKKGKRSRNINRHQSESGPFTCRICNKISVSLKNLKLHKKLHEKANPYTCFECNKAFASRRNYENHKKSFTGIHFSCDICGRSFRYKAEIESHIQGIHNTSFSTEKKDEQRIITFSCDECQKTFVSEVSLNIHKRNHELEKVLRVDSNDYMNNYTRVVKKRILKSQVEATSQDSNKAQYSTQTLERNHLKETNVVTLEDNDECSVDDPMPPTELIEQTDLNNEKENVIDTLYLPVHTNILKGAHTVDINSVLQILPSHNDSTSSLLSSEASLEAVHCVPISEQFDVQTVDDVQMPKQPELPELSNFHPVSTPQIAQTNDEINNSEHLVYSVQTPIIEQVYSVPQLNQQADYVTSQINQNPTTVNLIRSHSINQDSYSILKTMGTEEMLNVFDKSLIDADHNIEVIESDVVTNDSCKDNGNRNIDTTFVASNLQLEESLVTTMILENNESSKDASITPKNTVDVAHSSSKGQHNKSTRIIRKKSAKLNRDDLKDVNDINFIIIREVKPSENEDLCLNDESAMEEESESNLFADSEEDSKGPKEKRRNIMEYTVVEPQPNLSFDSMPMFETENELGD